MVYLLDANILIDANRDYYPLERIPGFWQWLVEKGKDGAIKMPPEVRNEITGDGELNQWLKRDEVKKALLELAPCAPALVEKVIKEGYGVPQPGEDDIKNLGRDPILIAHGMQPKKKSVVCTNEVSKPSRSGAKQHIPDVCNRLGVKHCTGFALFRDLDFRIVSR